MTANCSVTHCIAPVDETLLHRSINPLKPGGDSGEFNCTFKRAGERIGKLEIRDVAANTPIRSVPGIYMVSRKFVGCNQLALTQ